MIELRNICYEHDGKQILKNINLKFNNEITVITGPNGAGKSTLAKIIMGIIKPTSGSVLYNDQDITDFSITQRAKIGFSYSFQQPVKFKGLRVCDILRIANAKKDVALSKYLKSVGLCSREYMTRELSGDLSGGELKRVEIATVLARNTQVNIFDEPEAGIDLWSFGNLVETFSKFQKEINGIFIMISHQEKMINLANKIVLLNAGQVEKLGKKEEILPFLSNANKSCKSCGV